MKLTLRDAPRLTLTVMAAVGVAAAIACTVLLQGVQEELRAQALLRNGEAIAGRTRVLSARLEALVRLAETLSQAPPPAGLARAEAAGGVDPIDLSTAEQWRNRMAALLAAVMAVQPDVFQARYVEAGEDGREIVRLDRTPAGPVRSAEADLQAKGARGYMREANRRGDAPGFLTPIEMNKEHDRLDPREIPTLRAIAPVVSPGGRATGFIVLNIDLRETVTAAWNAAETHELAEVIDAEGRFRFSPLTAHRAAMAQETAGAAWTAYPALREMAARGFEESSTWDESSDDGRAIASVRPLVVPRISPPTAYALIERRGPPGLEPLLDRARDEALLLGLVLTAGAGVLTAAACLLLLRRDDPATRDATPPRGDGLA